MVSTLNKTLVAVMITVLVATIASPVISFAFQDDYVMITNEEIEEIEEVSNLMGASNKVLEVDLSKKSNSESSGGGVVKYSLKVRNNGNVKLGGVVATISMPTKMMYVIPDNNSERGYSYWVGKSNIVSDKDENGNVVGSHKEIEIALSDIEANSSIETELWFKTPSTLTAYTISCRVKAGENVDERSSGEELTKSSFNVQIETESSTSYSAAEGDLYLYSFFIKAAEKQDKIDNTVLTLTLPNELKYSSLKVFDENSNDITESVKVTRNDNNISINIGSVEGVRTKSIVLSTEVQNTQYIEDNKDVYLIGEIKGNGTDSQRLNIPAVEVSRPAFDFIQSSNVAEGTGISAGTEYKYSFQITNKSGVLVQGLEFVDNLPEGVNFKEMEIIYASGKIDRTTKINKNGKPAVTLNMQPRTSITINMTVIAGFGNSDIRVTNNGSLTHKTIGTITSNNISHSISKYVPGSKTNYVVPDTNVDNNNNNNNYENINDAQGVNVISGYVWIDTDSNGERSNEEARLPNVRVLLLNENGNNLKTTYTDNNGSYMFSGLENGKYRVVFVYDNSRFNGSTYKKGGVDELINSDAKDTEILLNGESRIAAVTDLIEVNGESKYNVDLGLIQNIKFDLSLSQKVSTIGIVINGETTTYTYGTEFAKADIPAQDANNSSIVVRYAMVIKNEGSVPGYINTVKDYLPKELNFSTELNRDWYEGENGVIYNSSLANQIINPGESKTIYLTLTKKMNRDAFGLFENTAELSKFSSDSNVTDSNSANNKQKTEVLITVKTGDKVYYQIGKVIIFVGLIVILKIFFKKKEKGLKVITND